MASNVNVGIKFTADAGNVPSVVAGIQDSVKDIAPPDAGNSLAEVTRRASELGQVGQQLTGYLQGFSNSLVGAAQNALSTAGNFEQLRAKLVSVTGSIDEANKKFKFATEFAATTPFDVKGIVGATALLEGFGQKAEQVLPAAANLASAMGTSLDDATRVIGKATSGSLEGFQSLRDVYAISTNDLKKFGAQVDTTGGILSRTPEQIEKNRSALLNLIKVRYGDAIQRQSETLNGALSNLGDTGEQLVNSFGENLIPIATAAAKSVTSMLAVVQTIPTGAKAAIAGVVAIGAGVAVLGAGIAAAVTGLLVLQSQLLAISATLAVEFPAAAGVAATAATGVSGALGLVTRAAGLCRSALVFLTTTPLGLSLTAIAAVAGIAGLAIANMDKQARASGDSITASANKFQQANTTLKSTIAGLNAAGKEIGVTVGIVASSREQFGQLQAAFQKLTPEQIVKTFSKAGETTESLKDKLKSLEAGASTASDKLKMLRRAQELLTQGGGFSDEFARLEKQLRDYGVEIDRGFGALGRMKEATKSLLIEQARIGEARLALTGLVAAFTKFAQPLEQAAADSKALGSFLDLSKQVGTTQALAGALEAVNAQIKANADTAGIGTDNLDKLLQKLRDPNASEVQKTAIKEQIALIQSQTEIVEKQADAVEKAIKAKLDAEENAFQLKKAGNDIQLHDELRHVQAMLVIAQQGSSESTALLRREAEVKKSIREAERKQAEDSLKSQIAAAKQLTNDSKAGIGDGVLKSLDEARNKVDAWAAANGNLLKTYPQLKAELEKFRTENSLEVKREQAKQAAETLRTLTSELAVFVAEADTNTGKLAATEASINAIKQARTLHLVDEQAAQAQINTLTKSKLALEKSIADEKRQQADQLAGLEQTNLQQSIQVLEARKAAGEKVDTELKKSREDLVKGQLDALEREKQAAIDKNGDVNAAEAQAATKRQGILQAETLRRFEELAKQTKDHDAALTAQEKRANASQAKRNGPLKTFEQAFGGPGAFNLGSVDLGEFNIDSTRPRGPTAPDFKKIKSKVDSQFSKKKGAVDATAATGGQVINDNKSLVINGADLYGPEFSKAVLDIFKKAKQESKLR